MLRYILLLTFSLFVSQVSMAADDIRYYDIEFILFENLGGSAQNSENWQLPKLSEDSASESEQNHVLGENFVMDAKLPYDPELMFVELADNQFKLTEEASKIKQSRTRTILMHKAWRQPGLPSDEAIRVKFKQVIGEENSVSAGNNDIDTAGKPYIEGSIKVILSRYLHADVNILYFKPVVVDPVSLEDEFANRETTSSRPENLHDNYAVFQLKEFRRRIRSTEVHYLDHPVFGMLLLISPYEKPEEPATGKDNAELQ